jgi:hypothetical protein
MCWSGMYMPDQHTNNNNNNNNNKGLYMQPQTYTARTKDYNFEQILL